MATGCSHTPIAMTNKGQIATQDGWTLTPPLLSTGGGLPRMGNLVQSVVYMQGAVSYSATNNVYTVANANSSATVGPVTVTAERSFNKVTLTIPAVSITTTTNHLFVTLVTGTALAGTGATCWTLPQDMRPASTLFIPVVSQSNAVIAGAALRVDTSGVVSFVTAVPAAALGAAFTANAQLFPASSSELAVSFNCAA